VHIFIDETGTFTGIGQPLSVSMLGALPDAPSYSASAFNSHSDGLYEAQSPQRPMRAKSNLLARFNLICPPHPFTTPSNF
jgi:hypothetical protein